MSGDKKHRRAASATPWDGISPSELTAVQRLVKASHESMYAFRHTPFPDGDAAFFNGYTVDACPHCGGPVKRNGRNASGIQTYRCKHCSKTATPITGTIFDNAKLPLSAWVDFILQALSFESVAAMTREDRRADTTTPYWMGKIFAILEGIQDDVVLSGRVWIDEKYWPVAAKDAVRRPDGKLPRGLSQNQMCIAIGTDESGKSLFLHGGFGKPNRKRTLRTFGGHIAGGSMLVHDMECSHSILISELELADERHNANLLKGIPDESNPLEPVNRMCYFADRFLSAHSGFSRNDLQGYLDLLWVAMNPPADRLEKAAFILDRAMRCPKTLRFREFYNVKPRSEA